MQPSHRSQQEIFYTALYHSLLHPNVFSDVNGQYTGFDGKVHTVPAGHESYANYSGWDIYRSQVQLAALLAPHQMSDAMQTMVDDYEQTGMLPKWTQAHGESYVMVGDPADPIIGGAYAFGARDFDVRAALQAMVSEATQPNAIRPGLESYLKLGYVPMGEPDVWGPASTTLEYTTADFSIAQLAKMLGDTSTYRTFLEHRRLRRGQLVPVHLDGAVQPARAVQRDGRERRGGPEAGQLLRGAERGTGFSARLGRQRAGAGDPLGVRLCGRALEDPEGRAAHPAGAVHRRAPVVLLRRGARDLLPRPRSGRGSPGRQRSVEDRIAERDRFEPDGRAERVGPERNRALALERQLHSSTSGVRRRHGDGLHQLGHTGGLLRDPDRPALERRHRPARPRAEGGRREAGQPVAVLQQHGHQPGRRSGVRELRPRGLELLGTGARGGRARAGRQGDARRAGVRVAERPALPARRSSCRAPCRETRRSASWAARRTGRPRARSRSRTRTAARRPRSSGSATGP